VLLLMLEPATMQTLSPAAKSAAMWMLVAAFVLVIAVVPFEFAFFRAVKSSQIVKALVLEFWVFVLIVLLLAGVILDWYATPRGMLVMLGLFVIFIAVTTWFLIVRFRLIAGLHVQVTLTRERARKDIELLLQAIRESAEKKEEEPEGSGGEAERDQEANDD